MRKKLTVVLFALWMAFMGQALGQSFTIDDVNTGTYPSVTLKIIQQDKKKVNKSDITVSENNKPVIDFSLVPIDISSPAAEVSNKKAVCILIENSGFVTSALLGNVKSAIKTVLNRADANTVFDICFYNDTRQNGSTNHVSTEFTNDFQSLIHDMNARVSWIKNDHPNVDLYKALYECIEFVANKTNLPDNRQIILIATGNTNGTSPIKLTDCVDKNKSTGIIINGIGLKSGNNNAGDNLKLACSAMKGKYEMDNSAADIANALDKYIKNGIEQGAAADKKPDTSLQGFYLKFTSAQTGGGNVPITVKVSIGGVEKTTTYQAIAVSSTGNNKNLFIIGIVVIVVIAGGIIALLLSSKKKKEEEERLSREETKRNEEAREKEKSVFADPKTALPAVDKTQFVAAPMPAQDQRKTSVAGIKTAKLFNLQGKIFHLTEMSNSIGRNAENKIVVQDPTVSGKHAIITNENGKWMITDQNSTNGLYVNGQKVSKTELFNGMELTFGKINCVFEIS